MLENEEIPTECYKRACSAVTCWKKKVNLDLEKHIRTFMSVGQIKQKIYALETKFGTKRYSQTHERIAKCFNRHEETGHIEREITTIT